MKKVFSSNSELIHIWASDVSRSARANSVSCGGGVLWSYNTAIGHHITNDKGESAVIVNMTSYSPTTSKHQSEMNYAVNHRRRIYLNHVGYNVQSLKFILSDRDRLIEAYENHAAKLLSKAQKARTKKEQYKLEAFDHLNELKTYLEFFGFNYSIDQINLESLKQAAINRENEQKRIAAEMKAQRIAAENERLEQWRKGANVYGYFEITALRIYGDQIQTTKGANIPIDHAVKVYPMLKRIHENGGSYTRTVKSIHLGAYVIDSFDGEHLKVGCHNIPFNEVQNIANQLGLN